MNIRIEMEVKGVLYSDRWEMLAHSLAKNSKQWRKSMKIVKSEKDNTVIYKIYEEEVK